jgi:ubiquinone/menaquinone biosynthesis C-methylase UbiE
LSTALMHYIQTQPAQKYVGAVAQGYDQKREESDKWKIEQEAIEGLLSDLYRGDWVVDVPCGTGRFFKFYHDKGFIFHGVDVSADMLQIAASKVVDPMKARLFQANVLQLPMADKSVDAAVMCRLTRWLTPEECQIAIKELQRVCRKKIVFTARVADHPHARPLEIFEAALDGWKVGRVVDGYVPEYKIIELVPA